MRYETKEISSGQYWGIRQKTKEISIDSIGGDEKWFSHMAILSENEESGAFCYFLDVILNRRLRNCSDVGSIIGLLKVSFPS